MSTRLPPGFNSYIADTAITLCRVKESNSINPYLCKLIGIEELFGNGGNNALCREWGQDKTWDGARTIDEIAHPADPSPQSNHTSAEGRTSFAPRANPEPTPLTLDFKSLVYYERFTRALVRICCACVCGVSVNANVACW